MDGKSDKSLGIVGSWYNMYDRGKGVVVWMLGGLWYCLIRYSRYGKDEIKDLTGIKDRFFLIVVIVTQK